MNQLQRRLLIQRVKWRDTFILEFCLSFLVSIITGQGSATVIIASNFPARGKLHCLTHDKKTKTPKHPHHHFNHQQHNQYYRKTDDSNCILIPSHCSPPILYKLNTDKRYVHFSTLLQSDSSFNKFAKQKALQPLPLSFFLAPPQPRSRVPT